MQNYVGRLRWDYGERSCDDYWRDICVSAHHEEDLTFSTNSPEEAFLFAMGLARQKINKSQLPGRPLQKDIMVRLLSLTDSDGAKIDFNPDKATLVRPMFRGFEE